MLNERREFRAEDFVVRPAWRILGALLLGFLAFLFANNARITYYLAQIVPEKCKLGKSQFFCELGNWINSLTPISLQGPLAAAAHMGTALILLTTMWFLIKPLFKKS